MKKILCFLFVCLFVCFSACAKSIETLTSSNTDTSNKISGEEFSKIHDIVVQCVTNGYEFEEKQVVPIDKLLWGFSVFELTDANDLAQKFWETYKTGFGKFKIPKEELKKYLESRYSVLVDDSKSEYIEGDFIKISSTPTEPSSIVITSFLVQGNRIVVEGYEVSGALDGEDSYIYLYERDYEICIENFRTDNYKFIYYKISDFSSKVEFDVLGKYICESDYWKGESSDPPFIMFYNDGSCVFEIDYLEGACNVEGIIIGCGIENEIF